MKNKLFIASLIGISFLSACKKDDETKPALPTSDVVLFEFSDPTAPGEQFSTSDTLRNAVDLAVNFPANTNIQKVEMYVDGKLISEDLATPYAFSWNTIPENDGAHTVKAIIYDKDGKKVEKTTDVYVENALLNLKVFQLSEQDNNRYIIVSDADGTILYSTKLESNKEYKVKLDRPYQKETINVTDASTFSNTLYNSSSANSYIGIRRGAKWTYGYQNVNTTTDFNSVKLHLKNVPSFSKIWLSTNYSGLTITNLQDTTDGINFAYSSDFKLLVQIQKAEGTFYDFLPISGTDMNVDVSAITKPCTKSEITIPEWAFPNSLLVGYPKTSSETGYSFGYENSSTSGKVTFIYPPGVFSKYFSYISYSSTNMTYTNSLVGEIPSEFQELKVSTAFTSKKLTNFSATFSGDFDYYKVSYNYSKDPNYGSWYVFAPSHIKDYKLPEIASVIGVDYHTADNLILWDITFNDYANFSEDGSSFKYYSTYPSSIPFSSSTSVSYHYFSNSNLRIRNTSKETVDWKELVESTTGRKH